MIELPDTDELFREDSYLRQCGARIVGADSDGVYLDRTVFYPMGGGQPGDTGVLTLDNGARLQVVDTQKGERHGTIKHFVDAGSLAPEALEALIGSALTGEIEWARRYRMMRVHTLLHLLCSVIPAGVTGGAIRDDGTGRLDFDLPESTLDKAELSQRLNQLVEANHDVSARWVDEADLDANPDLVRTMSVAPPRGQGRVRVLDIESVDLQPCGGTHVASTLEIGGVAISKVEKKGKHNRRVSVKLLEP